MILKSIYPSREREKYKMYFEELSREEQLECVDRLKSTDRGEFLEYLINSPYTSVRIGIIKKRLFLERFLKDDSESVRVALVRKGFGLEELSEDKSWIVRLVVLQRGFQPEKFINDESEYVRAEVARQGFGFEVLINDKEQLVPLQIAKQGYKLEELLNSEFPRVRLEVAKQGYGLSTLINDLDDKVREKARKVLGAEVFIIASDLTPSLTNLYLYAFDNDYIIANGRFEFNNLSEWILNFEYALGTKKTDSYVKKILEILKNKNIKH